MTDQLPAPLVSADVDLRDFAFVPVLIARLFGSAFHARANDAEWRAGFTLWLKSWHQQPAASVPEDDVELTRLAELGRDVRAWRKVKAMALYGWVKCSDGRLYHPVVAELAVEAWRRKVAQRDRTQKARNARHNVSDMTGNNLSNRDSDTDRDKRRNNGSHDPSNSVQGTGTGTGTERSSSSGLLAGRATPPICQGFDPKDLQDIIGEILDASGFSAVNQPQYLRQVWAWFEAGCHPELDVRDTIRDVMRRKNGGKPGSLSYFTKAIEQARDVRVERETEAAELRRERREAAARAAH